MKDVGYEIQRFDGPRWSGLILVDTDKPNTWIGSAHETRRAHLEELKEIMERVDPLADAIETRLREKWPYIDIRQGTDDAVEWRELALDAADAARSALSPHGG